MLKTPRTLVRRTREVWLNIESSHVNGSDECNAVIVSADGH